MSGRAIYVDIDDVLSHTVESLIDLLERLHDRRIEVADCLHFDLGRSFSLDEESLQRFMHHAHSDEVIVSIEPIAGAAQTLDEWSASGDRVTLVTGRPPSTRAASLLWLEAHGLEHDALHHLDKWNRPSWNEQDLPALRFEEIGHFGFEFAVEDSLETAVRLIEEFAIPVALMDRPWNREVGSLSRRTRDSLVRCRGWDEVATRFGGSEAPLEKPGRTRSAASVSGGSALGRADEHGEG